MRIFILLSLFITSFTYSQGTQVIPVESPLRGVVYDSITNLNLEFVSVRVYSKKDSSVMDGVLTDAEGVFSFKNVNPTRVYLVFSYVGYENKIVKSLLGIDPENLLNLKIGLKPSMQNLEEVKVVGNLDVLKTGIDKKVYNVGEDLNTQGGSASDVLNNVPSIEVDQDGNISLRGNGNVIILIDGRPSTLTLNNGLSGLPANSVERIEVVTNPSAKYDPDGTSGIINIVLKKSKLRGINGVVSSTGGTGYSLNNSFTLNARTGKFNVFGTYSNSYSDGYRDFNSSLETTTNQGAYLLIQDRPGDHLRRNHNLRVGMDVYLTDKQTIGFSVNGALGDQNRTGILYNEFFDPNMSVESAYNRSAIDLSEDKNLDFNLNYTAEFKKEGKLSANFTSSLGNEINSGVYINNYLTAGYVPSSQLSLEQRLRNKENNRVSTGQLDYEKVLAKKNARIELGAKVILRNDDRDSYSETLDTLNNQFYTDTLANFRYNYTEEIYSTYGIWGQKVNKWKYQVGFRGEYAQQIPYLIDDSLRIRNAYFNFFPSAHLRYELPKKQELSLSYSKRINRASSGELNPFVNYSDPLNLRVGNPYLTPEYIQSFDLGFSKETPKLNFTSSVYYRMTRDVIQRVKVFYDNSVTATTYGNIDQSQSYGVEAVINYKPNKWWRNTLSINGNRIQYFNSSGEDNFNNSGFNMDFKYTGTVDFWKKTASFQVNIRYNTPRITAQGKVLPRSTMDISGSKKINDHWNLGMRLSDVFNTQGFQYDFSQGNVRQLGEYKWLTRRFYLTVTYKFGKLELQKREGKGREESGGGGGGMDF